MNETDGRGTEAGFTLIEVLTAVVILTFGLMAVSNLFFAATTSNSVASGQTATASVASQVLELLKEIPYQQLVALGNAGSITVDAAGCPALPNAPGITNCFVDTVVPGVGVIHSRWTIAILAVAGGTADEAFLTVQSDSTGTFLQGRSRTQLTTVRACVNKSAQCP
jgi:prepilin-type N-terminal cleavage/methylation domain-containing protein